jgi:hypothetical protein
LEVSQSSETLVLIYKQKTALLKALLSLLNAVRILSIYVVKYFVDKFIARLEISVSGFCSFLKTMNASMP